VDERPELGIDAQDDVPPPAAVASVGPAFGDILGPVQMGTARTAVAAGAKNAHIVYEIGFCHNAAKVVKKRKIVTSLRLYFYRNSILTKML
jgi:hypothetical protein